MAVLSEGKLRSGDNAGDEKALELTENRDLFVAAGLPPYAEMTRLGGGYSAIATAAVAGLVVRPGTTAGFTLWNGESAGGKSYIVDRLFSHCLVSGGEDGRFGIWACIHPAGMTDPGEDIAASATNVTGNYGRRYDGNAVVGVGETVIDNGWYPWGRSSDYELTGVLPGAVAEALVDGRLIIPPQGGISLQVVASIADSTYASGLSWYEYQLDLE